MQVLEVVRVCITVSGGENMPGGGGGPVVEDGWPHTIGAYSPLDTGGGRGDIEQVEERRS